MMSSSWRI